MHNLPKIAAIAEGKCTVALAPGGQRGEASSGWMHNFCRRVGQRQQLALIVGSGTRYNQQVATCT